MPHNAIPAPLRRILRYGGVGLAISTIYSLTVIAAMHVLNPTLASVLAFAIVLPMSWLAHGRISFGDRPRDRFQPMRFALSTTASFAIAVGGMYWITEVAGRNYLLGIAWNWMIIPTVNFVAYMFWVFRSKRNRSQLA